ncbi:LON peptidase N-terminal domain and RING finger protein [Elsinoe australis]|uniref:LON peptidase N-terminal domain and RING finger protein n=1 Tax=Elsinoe australis TaxID=40998 RepID=A0A2P7Z469_9PEZI|nr:LON peptidase N-terminal domain and RING finger protein [Elsinoe australis]
MIPRALANVPVNQSAPDVLGTRSNYSTDVWSAAFREAASSIEDCIDSTAAHSRSVEELLQNLNTIGRDAVQDSAFLRGVQHLQDARVPLESFKLALDLATPLTSLEPTTATVFGVVRSVTAIAISFASADLVLAKQIGEMLEHISYIDGCDTLGQKVDSNDIHRALVKVYQDILMFYKEARDILAKKGAKLLAKLVLDNARIPEIIEEFLGHAAMLQKVVEKATLEVLEDMRNMLYDCQSGDNFDTQNRYHNEQLRDLRSDLVSGSPAPAADAEKLKDFLQQVLQRVDRPLFFLVDGLDECDWRARNSLLALFTHLSSKSPRLKVVISARPEKGIHEQFHDAARINLEMDLEKDTLLATHLVTLNLPHLSQDVKSLVIERVSVSASGSAIWARMVIELIRIRQIQALGPMRSFLNQMPLPEALSKIYESLIVRCTLDDHENYQLALAALKFLAVARRPLSILELAWAATLARAPSDIRSVSALDELVDHQRILGLVHPFITRIDFQNLEARQVRLVHQSVKEFLLQMISSASHHLSPSHGGQELQYGQGGQVVDSMEALSLETCARYLLLKEIDEGDIFTPMQVAIDELPQEYDLFSDQISSVDYDRHCDWETWEESMIRYDPAEQGFGQLFVYASCYWLEHFGACRGICLSLDTVQDLCRAGSPRLSNWTRQNSRPDCVMKARFEFDGRLYDALSITALYGSETMVHHLLQDSNLDDGRFLPDTVISAADQIIQWSDTSRLALLLDYQRLKSQLQTSQFFKLIINRWSDIKFRNRDWDAIFHLLDQTMDSLSEEQWAEELLDEASQARCEPLVRLFTPGPGPATAGASR